MSVHTTTPTLFGLTGGISSGKTTVANYFAHLGAYLIDTDIIAREVVKPHSATTLRIRDLLGADYLLDDGNLNRAAIKTVIFNNDDIKQQYEAIILPAIRQATLAAIDNIPQDVCYALLIVPLLFEKGLDKYTDYTISVDLPTDVQIERAIARNPRDKDVIENIIAAQMPRELRNERADFVINNHQPLEKLYEQLNILHVQLCQLPVKRNISDDAFR